MVCGAVASFVARCGATAVFNSRTEKIIMHYCRFPNGQTVALNDSDWKQVAAGKARVSERGGIEPLSGGSTSTSVKWLSLQTAQRRYPRPHWSEVEKSLAFAAELTECPAGSPGVVVGLAADYNAVFRHGVNEAPRVFLPGAFNQVKRRHRPLRISHRDDLEIISESGSGVLLYGCDQGLMLKAILPDTDLGRAAAVAMLAGRLSGLSIGYEIPKSEMVDGVLEISQAEVTEISLADTPLAPLCCARIVSRMRGASSNHSLIKWLDAQLA
jgi:HK97 family phage prohead protease